MIWRKSGIDTRDYSRAGRIKRKGIRQYVLSALKEDLLIGMLERFGIREYFEGVCGSNNIYADGKVARGMEMLQMFPIVPGETVMVGDTLHDAEVAETLGLILGCMPEGIIVRNGWRRKGSCCNGWSNFIGRLIVDYIPNRINFKLFLRMDNARWKWVFTVVSAISISSAISRTFFFSTTCSKRTSRCFSGKGVQYIL